jgi:hypothetical protein
MGWYHERPDAVEIFPGPDAYPAVEAGVIYFDSGKISRIVSLKDNTGRKQFLLEPQLLANLSENR